MNKNWSAVLLLIAALLVILLLSGSWGGMMGGWGYGMMGPWMMGSWGLNPLGWLGAIVAVFLFIAALVIWLQSGKKK